MNCGLECGLETNVDNPQSEIRNSQSGRGS
jgi:hypothetical protein